MYNIHYEDKQYNYAYVCHCCQVVSGNGPILLGYRSWLQQIPLNWTKLFQQIFKADHQLSQLLQSFSDVFKDGLGALQGSKVHIYIDPVATRV